MARATVMMVTYNRLNLSKRTFESTLKNAGEKYNLVIIDNNSEDDTVKWLIDNIDEYDLIEDYRVVKLNENNGISYGRNMGLKICDDNFPTEYLCTLDNDVELPSGWLRDCCNVLKNNSKIGACGVNLEGIRYNKAFIKTKDGNKPIEIQIKQRGNLGTAAMVFPYAIHEKVGYFCSDFKYYGHEDALFGWVCRMIKPMLVYLGENGNHLGVGTEDEGEYREMKNKYWDINMPIFHDNVKRYRNGSKPIYTDFVPNKEEIWMKSK